MALFCITGLQYAGAKTLFEHAKKPVEESPKYCFLHPIISPAGSEVPGQTVLTEEEFNNQKDSGDIFASWKTGAISYGFDKSIFEAAESGKKIVITLPRDQYPNLEKTLQQQKPAFSTTLINLVVNHEILVTRASEVEEKFVEKVFRAKLKKYEDLRGDNIVKVENNGGIEEGVEEIKKAIGFDPLIDIPAKELGGDGSIDLLTCSPQDYLKTTLYPYLNPALESIQRERPGDPLEYLAVYLYKSATTAKKREKELLNLKAVKTHLREKIKKEYSVIGRV